MTNIKKKAKQKLFYKNVYKLVTRDLVTPADFALNKKIESHRKVRNFMASRGWSQPLLKRLDDKIRELIAQLNAQTKIAKIEVIENIVPTVGLTAVIDHLTNSSPSPSTLKINYGALGTGTTTPALGDTTLETEVYRNTVASATKSNAIGYISLFFSATETNGTYREVGLFINGTGSADTGTLFSHAAINITKSSVQTLTIDFTITLANA